MESSASSAAPKTRDTMWVKQAWRFLPAYPLSFLRFLPSSNREIFRGSWRCYSLHTQSSPHQLPTMKTRCRRREEMKKWKKSSTRLLVRILMSETWDYIEKLCRVKMNWTGKTDFTRQFFHHTAQVVMLQKVRGFTAAFFSLLAAQYLSGIWIALDEINA